MILRFLIRVVAELIAFGVMLGLGALLLTPWGLMASPLIIVGAAVLWWGWKRIRNRRALAYWPIFWQRNVAQLSSEQRVELIVNPELDEAFTQQLWTRYWNRSHAG